MADKENLLYLFKSLSTFTPASGGKSSSGTNTCVANNNATTVQSAIATAYNTPNTSLKNLVTPAGGYGWQKFIVQETGNYQVVIRGGSGGISNERAITIDPVTGVCSGYTSTKTAANGTVGRSYSRGGRGAKLTGNIKLNAGDILYLLVGMMGKCSNDSYGGGGGGASVLLRENPNGDYTLNVVNKKVDVLMVAGGGGGGCSQQHVLDFNRSAGKDGVVTNGTNTNGGTSIIDTTQETTYKGGAGAGLTGAGTPSTGSNALPLAILSGTTTYVTGSCASTWGGGGINYENGGGGGGYSGGNANRSAFNYKDRTKSLGAYGGDGGTSYMNPKYVKDIARGYATVAEDSTRDLTNPWYAHGSIEISFAAPSEKYILAQDTDGVKYFNGTVTKDGEENTTGTDTWQLLPDGTALSEATYKQYGNYEITNINGLLPTAKFLVMSLSEEDNISIDGFVNQSIIKQNEDINIGDVSLIKSLVSTTNLTGLDVKFAISKNSGKTWQTYSSGTWADISITDKNDFSTNGYNLSLIASIPIEVWNDYKAKNIRFAFIVTQNADNGSSIISNIKIVADLVGSWRHFKESEATYEYTSNDTLKVTFLQNGNYKVNYLDNISSSSST